MKTIFWLFKIETRQNYLHILLVCLASVFLGTGAKLAWKAQKKISSLVTVEQWNADLVVLPKGIGLEDFRKELQTGQTTAFLPEAMYLSTVALSEGQFQTRALLAIRENGGSEILTQGDASLGPTWLGLPTTTRPAVAPWREQNIYFTPEWKNKLISGFFAAGSPLAMKNLKDLIDRKTVGQAWLIEEQQRRDLTNQATLQNSLEIFSLVVIGLFSLCFLSLIFWLRSRLINTARVLHEIGHPSYCIYTVLGLLFLCFSGLPLILSFLLTGYF